MPRKKTSRRDFVRLAATSSLAAGVAPAVLGAGRKAHTLEPRRSRPVSPNDKIRIATIGAGIIGFIDTRTALEVDGTELVAAADLYDGRLTRVKESFGQEVSTTRDYREILARSDVDAVIISVPDHWHKQIAVEAMQAGKDVYLEKPMVQHLDQGPEVIKAASQTGRILQVGSQFASSVAFDKVKELFEAGAIGELNMIEATYNRNSAIGAWQYSIPNDASPETIDWETFVAPAPPHPFDPVRFFRWRNYWDYGTGVGGDLFVHLFTSIHYALSSNGPNKVMSTGGLRYWKDGRDVPDVMLALLEYPETAAHPPFTLSLQINFKDGSGGKEAFRFIGSEGVIDIDNWHRVVLTRLPTQAPTESAIFRGYNSMMTFAGAMQTAMLRQYREDHPQAGQEEIAQATQEEFTAPRGYDERLDHFKNFFDAVRTRGSVVEDPVFGYRAAAPALLTNLSYIEDKIYHWDPDTMQVKKAS